jgi:dipeptidyl aminopeptidase/acylaminoacyl peptidase
VRAAAAAGGTPFHDLARYVAIPRVTALRLSPDGSWLAATIQTLTPDRKKYVTSIWRIPAIPAIPAHPASAGPVRLTWSPDGETDPRFLPDGSLLFISKRPGQHASDPDGTEGSRGATAAAGGQAGLWRLPAAGGEAIQVADRPGGVSAVETSELTGATVIASAVMPGAGAQDAGDGGAGVPGDDARLRQARADAGVTAILHESVPVRYWDHDLGPAQLRLFAVDPAATGQDGVAGPGGPDGPDGRAGLRDLTPAPGSALDQQSFCVSADGSTVAAGWWRWETRGELHAELALIDVASAVRRTLLSAPGFDYEHPAISPDGRYVACIRSAHHEPESPGDVTIVLCQPGGATPLEPPAALRAPDVVLADTTGARRAGGPDSLCQPGGATPLEPPAALRAPDVVPADTTGARRAGGPDSLAGYDRLAVGPAEDPAERLDDVAGGPGGPGERDLLGGFDRRPAELVWAPDSRSVYFTADDRGRRPVFRVDTGTGAIARITADDGAYTDLCPSPDGGWLFALRSSPDEPPVPVRLEAAEGHKPERLASPGGPLELPGRLEEIETAADDGVRIRSWLVLPAAASAQEPAPLVLWVHGGPMSSWNSWSWRWNPWLMAARGYAVLLPDPALSTGYGQNFIARAYRQWGDRPYADVVAATDAAVARPDIDGSRTAMMGGSYGGYMANWVAGHTDRFRAIVSHAGLWVLDQMFGTTDLPMFWRPQFGDPLTSPERYEANSPHRHVAHIRTPMLIIHGNKDYRVPVGEALRLWWDLSRHGAEAKFLYFPDENHWILGPGHAAVWYETVFAFLAQHVLGEPWRRPGLL